jgi:hypothetical protein
MAERQFKQCAMTGTAAAATSDYSLLLAMMLLLQTLQVLSCSTAKTAAYANTDGSHEAATGVSDAGTGVALLSKQRHAC